MFSNTVGPKNTLLGTCVSRGVRGEELLQKLEEEKIKVWQPAREKLKEIQISRRGANFEFAVVSGRNLSLSDRCIATVSREFGKSIFANKTPEELAIHIGMGISVEEMLGKNLSRIVVMHEPIERFLSSGIRRVSFGKWLYAVEVIPVKWPRGGSGPDKKEFVSIPSICLTMVCADHFSGSLAEDYGYAFSMRPKESVPVSERAFSLRDILRFPLILRPAIG